MKKCLFPVRIPSGEQSPREVFELVGDVVRPFRRHFQTQPACGEFPDAASCPTDVFRRFRLPCFHNAIVLIFIVPDRSENVRPSGFGLSCRAGSRTGRPVRPAGSYRQNVHFFSSATVHKSSAPKRKNACFYKDVVDKCGRDALFRRRESFRTVRKSCGPEPCPDLCKYITRPPPLSRGRAHFSRSFFGSSVGAAFVASRSPNRGGSPDRFPDSFAFPERPCVFSPQVGCRRKKTTVANFPSRRPSLPRRKDAVACTRD